MYPVIGRPPSLAGGSQDMRTAVSIAVAVTLSGEEGGEVAVVYLKPDVRISMPNAPTTMTSAGPGVPGGVVAVIWVSDGEACQRAADGHVRDSGEAHSGDDGGEIESMTSPPPVRAVWTVAALLGRWKKIREVPQLGGPLNNTGERAGELIAVHRFGWTTFEVVAMAAVIVAPWVFVYVAKVSVPAAAVVLGLLGVLAAGLLWNISRTRKSDLALELRDDQGTWKLYTGGKVAKVTSEVVFEQVTAVAGVQDSSGNWELILTSEEDGRTQSLRIPERLLEENPALRQLLLPVVKDLKGSSRAVDLVS